MTHFSPYHRLMRLDRPTGIWLLLWPCWWSIAFASRGSPSIYLLTIFGLGAIIMRGAGCIVNDIIDRKLDAQVERTKDRPLARSELSLTQAIILLAVLLAAGLVILLQLNSFTIWLGIFSLIPICIYPLMKRVTYWPQAFLGLIFTWGALMGWAAVRGSLQWPAIILYISCFFWTLGYDTIYAHQDKHDDRKAGIKSTALALQDRTKIFLYIWYGLMAAGFALAGTLLDYRILFYIIVIISLLYVIRIIHKLDLNSPQNCYYAFRANIFYGGLLFCAVLAGKILVL